MVNTKARSTLDAIKPQPASARLPTERRDLAARQALRRRIQHEFTEMPGLSLTLAQASRLFGVAPDACARICGELIEDGFLCGSAEKGHYWATEWRTDRRAVRKPRLTESDRR